MDELNITNRGFSPHFSPSRNLSVSENNQQQLFIHLPNHGFRVIRIDEVADVRSMVNSLVGSMSNSSSGGTNSSPQYCWYALRLRHMITKEIVWLPLSEFKWFLVSSSISFGVIDWLLDTPTRIVVDYISNESCSNISCPAFDKTSSLMVEKTIGNSNGWKIELRIRYVPKNLEEFLERDSKFSSSTSNIFTILSVSEF